jgi:hypothetical protein
MRSVNRKMLDAFGPPDVQTHVSGMLVRRMVRRMQGENVAVIVTLLPPRFYYIMLHPRSLFW